MRGLYIHIPFCRRKCCYCNFVSTADQSTETRLQFLASLEKEAANTFHRYGRLHFDTIYLGGGTPSLLTEREMTQLFDLLRAHFDFSPECETTCEMNPGDLEENKLKVCRDLGINRVSLGAQAFQESLLKELGRTHTIKDIFEAVRLLSQTGITNISLDLMIRLPGQTVEDVAESIRYAISLGVSQVTVYDLEVHEKTVFGARQKRGELGLPNSDRHEEMFRLVESYLTSAGYRHYELLSFAKRGFESKHNLIYWHNQEYLGLGPGAFSYLNGTRYQFAGDVGHYFKKCAADDWAPEVADRLTTEQKETESLLTGLRLAEGVDLNNFQIIRGVIENELPELVANGLVERKESRIALTRRGRFLADNVISRFVNPETEPARRMS